MRSERRNTTRLAQLALIGLCVALAGCGQPSPPPQASAGKADEFLNGQRKPRLSVTIGAASAQTSSTAKVAPQSPQSPQSPQVSKAPPAPTPPVRAGSPVVIRERAVSAIPYPSEAEAEEDAIARACELVALKLSQLNPPVSYQPSPEELKEKYLRHDSRAVGPPSAAEKQIIDKLGDTRNFVKVEYDVEVTAEQVRELRSRDRVWLALRVMGGLFALALAGFLFLRADEWTKGYLTSWLALAAVTLAGGAAAALIFI